MNGSSCVCRRRAYVLRTSINKERRPILAGYAQGHFLTSLEALNEELVGSALVDSRTSRPRTSRHADKLPLGHLGRLPGHPTFQQERWAARKARYVFDGDSLNNSPKVLSPYAIRNARFHLRLLPVCVSADLCAGLGKPLRAGKFVLCAE